MSYQRLSPHRKKKKSNKRSRENAHDRILNVKHPVGNVERRCVEPDGVVERDEHAELATFDGQKGGFDPHRLRCCADHEEVAQVGEHGLE